MLGERAGGLSRRRVIQGAAGLGLALAGTPLGSACRRSEQSARAEPPARVYRIGWLGYGPPLRTSTPLNWQSGPPGPSFQRLMDRLAELGYVEGQTLHWEYRGATDPDQLAADAAELVALPVDVIFIQVAPRAVRAAFETPGTTPVVVAAFGTDPVAEGYAQSLARPGGKVTGVLYSPPGAVFGPKRLEVLKEVLPALTRLGVLLDVGDANVNLRDPFLAWHAVAARELGIELLIEEVRALEEVDGACANMARAGAEAMLPHTRLEWTAGAGLARLIEAALRQGMPTMGLNQVSARIGTLVAYGSDIVAIHGRTAEYLDKVLRGARPADLPIEYPDRYELTINACAAEKLGLTIPPAVLRRATEVIQCP